MKKFSVVPALSLRPIQIVQREVIYFPFVVRKNESELSKNLNIHCKSREISGPYNFLTPIKSSTPDVWNWTCWTLFGLDNEVGWWVVGWVGVGMNSLHPFRWLRPRTCTCHIIKLSKLQKHVFHHYKTWERKLVFVCFLKKLTKSRNRWPRTTLRKKNFESLWGRRSSCRICIYSWGALPPKFLFSRSITLKLFRQWKNCF